MEALFAHSSATLGSTEKAAIVISSKIQGRIECLPLNRLNQARPFHEAHSNRRPSVLKLTFLVLNPSF